LFYIFLTNTSFFCFFVIVESKQADQEKESARINHQQKQASFTEQIYDES